MISRRFALPTAGLLAMMSVLPHSRAGEPYEALNVNPAVIPSTEPVTLLLHARNGVKLDRRVSVVTTYIDHRPISAERDSKWVPAAADFCVLSLILNHDGIRLNARDDECLGVAHWSGPGLFDLRRVNTIPSGQVMSVTLTDQALSRLNTAARQ